MSAAPAPRPRTTGLGRVLVALYAVFAIAAVSRAGVQIATDFHEAPLAYALSAFAGVVYVLATVGLGRTGRRWRTVAWVACSVELLGVLTVGVLSLADAEAFPRATVWSGFGQGYGYVPLVLPVLGLVYLRRESRAART
ncbi:hypothetical protein [Kineococcus sp. SYSU DK001]|uniref:hypothetical protein n=1 Tax=Kineococcus sp. SYSU DK001 TaxID=3383122 RepID=UPI003D7D51B2